MRSHFVPAGFPSSAAPHSRRRALRTSGVVMIALAATLAGCSSDDAPGAASPSSPLPALATADADMSAVGGPTVLIGPSGRQVRLDIKPIADFVAEPGVAPPYAPRSFRSAGRLQREEPKPWPGAAGAEPIPASAWVLAYAAAASCGVGGGVTEEGVGPNPHLAAPPILPTWKQGPNGTRAFGMFPAPPATCEEALAQSEALVCTAARLSALASSPGVTLLKSVEPVAVRDGLPPGPWAFPPMAEDQRALARELALHLLAHVAVTDMVRPGGGTDGATCSERWGRAASDPDAMLVQADTLFGTLEGREPAFYPPRLPVNAQSVRRMAATRLQIEAHVLRLASRVTAELQRVLVESAVDAGRARAARTGSADAAARTLWGMDGTGRYERASMAGAFRASAGRLDLGSGAPDRACAGTPGSRLLADRFGADLDAHVLTPAPTSAGERDAVALIEGLGLVLPDAVVEQLGDDELRSMVAEQAAWSLARADGDAPVDVDAKRDLSQRRVAGLATGDLRFALRRSWGLYRAVTGAGRDAVAVAPHALLPAVALDTAPAVASQGGGVVPGLSQDRLPRNGTARLATMAAAAACPQDPLVATDAGQSFDEAFQGAAPLRGVLYRRLLLLRESARKAGFGGTTSLGRALSTMSGEARAVAGGRVAIQRTGSRLSARLSGFDPAMLPGSTPEAIADNLVVVRGSPLIAECAAGLRHDCPPGVVAAATVHAQDVIVDQVALSDAAEVTAEGRGLTATYVLPPGTGSETTYLIAGTTETTGGEGAVLGALVPVGPDGEPPTGGGGSDGDGEGGVLVFTTTQDPPNPGGGPISGLTDDGPRRPSDLGDYCTTGLTKMTYVPVSNELTGSVGEPTEPSFRQWIDLAKKASARADELGHRALDQQAQSEMRREGATEELRRLCGDVGSLSDVTFVNGKIVTSNASLADCMGLPGSAVDVAWLTTDPVKGAGDAPLVGGVLGCDVDGNKPLCKKLAQGVCPGSGASCQGVSHAGLGLASYTTVSAPDGDCRANVLQAMQGYGTGSSLGALTKLSWAGPDGLDNAIGYLSVREVPGGAWEVLHGSTPVMSTDLASGKFPACAQPGAKACDSDAYYFSALFRSASTKPVPCEPGYVEAGSPAVGCVAQLGGAADGLDASEELRALLWRVEGAIWLLGAMGSGVPSGAFEVAVPVVDYGSWPDGDKAAPAVTYFGATGMVSSAANPLDTQVYQPKGLPQIDAATLSPLYAKPAGSWPSSLLGQMPPHFGVVYGTQGRYVQTYQSYVGATRTAPLTLEKIQALAAAMSGGSCPTLYGAGGPAGGVAEINQVLDYEETRFVCSMDGKVPVSQPGLFAEVASSYPAMLFRGPLVPTPSRQAWSGTNEDGGAAWSVWGGFGIFPQTSTTSVDWPCQPTKDPSTGLWLIHSTCVAQDLEAEYACDKNNGYPSGQSINPLSDKCAGLGTAAYRPTSCSPAERAGYWVNRFGPKTGCEARAMAYQALGLACQASSSATVGSKPPAVTKIEHLALVEAWTKVEAARFRRKLGALHLEYVPRRVVDDFAGGKIGSGPLGGARGEQILAYERALQEITTGWISIEQGLLGVADALKATNLQLQSLQIQATKENASLALQSIQLEMQRVQAVLAATNTIAQVGLTSPGAVAASGLALAQVGVVEHYAALAKTQSAIIAQAIVENKANQTAVALLQLHQTTNGHYEKIQQSLSAVRSATAGGLAAGNRLRELAVQARVEAAKATTGIGSAGPADAVGNPPVDYVLADTNGDGTEEPVPLAVNSVLRRTYDIDQLRYLRQEKEAKRLACLARMSVEQRIGRRLSSLQSPVGDEIPASWADEVAFATGFHPLMGKELALPIADPAALPGLQNLCPGAKSLDDANLCKDAWSAVLGSVQFVGDYVQRLEDFVGLYTAKAPFKEADDVTILSLAKDVLAASATCRTPSRNLLRSSGRLATSFPTDEAPGFIGWRGSKCTAGQASCLVASEVLSEASPPPPLVPIPPPSLPLEDGITWLLEMPAPGGAGGAAGSGGSGGSGGMTGGSGGMTGGSAGAGAPAGSVVDVAASSEAQIYQIVRLSPGAHTLSWWAASLEPNGTPAASARTKYAARVLGPSGAVVTWHVDTAGPVGAKWPVRETLGIQVQQEGLYAIVFGGLQGLDGLPGSLAIADVQLEVDPSGYGATPYEATGLHGLITKGSNCAANGKDLRRAFSYECTPNPALPEQPGPDLCRWVLRQPFSLLDGFSGGAEDAPSRLRGRFARGNDNYRHVSIAVNLVGTNVHSCPGGSSPCYASGYEQFGLLHDASAVHVLTGSPGAETFNFARGFIHDGRAIATEKYLTLPLSSNDAAMLSQPNFERPELRGRPLDGQYYFSIVDSPTFRFENLEDVQFVLHYHYWSAVDGGGGPPAPGGYGAPPSGGTGGGSGLDASGGKP